MLRLQTTVIVLLCCLAVPALSAQSRQVGDWTYEVGRHPVTGDTRGTARTVEVEEVTGHPERATLSVKCTDAGELTVLFYDGFWRRPDMVEGGDSLRSTVSFDGGDTSVAVEWEYVGYLRTLRLRGEPAEILRAMMQRDSMTIADREGTETEFGLEGAATALQAILEGCGVTVG